MSKVTSNHRLFLCYVFVLEFFRWASLGGNRICSCLMTVMLALCFEQSSPRTRIFILRTLRQFQTVSKLSSLLALAPHRLNIPAVINHPVYSIRNHYNTPRNCRLRFRFRCHSIATIHINHKRRFSTKVSTTSIPLRYPVRSTHCPQPNLLCICCSISSSGKYGLKNAYEVAAVPAATCPNPPSRIQRLCAVLQWSASTTSTPGIGHSPSLGLASQQRNGADIRESFCLMRFPFRTTE